MAQHRVVTRRRWSIKDAVTSARRCSGPRRGRRRRPSCSATDTRRPSTGGTPRERAVLRDVEHVQARVIRRRHVQPRAGRAQHDARRPRRAGPNDGIGRLIPAQALDPIGRRTLARDGQRASGTDCGHLDGRRVVHGGDQTGLVRAQHHHVYLLPDAEGRAGNRPECLPLGWGCRQQQDRRQSGHACSGSPFPHG